MLISVGTFLLSARSVFEKVIYYIFHLNDSQRTGAHISFNGPPINSAISVTISWIEQVGFV